MARHGFLSCLFVLAVAACLRWQACDVFVTLHSLPRQHCTVAATQSHMHIVSQSITTTSIGGESTAFSARACIAGMALLGVYAGSAMSKTARLRCQSRNHLRTSCSAKKYAENYAREEGGARAAVRTSRIFRAGLQGVCRAKPAEKTLEDMAKAASRAHNGPLLKGLSKFAGPAIALAGTIDEYNGAKTDQGRTKAVVSGAATFVVAEAGASVGTAIGAVCGPPGMLVGGFLGGCFGAFCGGGAVDAVLGGD